MLIANISVMGWLHSIACIVALIAGTIVMTARKGTRSHRRLGWWYAGAMAVQAVTIMAVYRFDILPGRIPKVGPHIFGMFHWMAVASFIAVALAILAATRQRRSAIWAHVHAQAMLFSYYLLMGGLINEAIVRVMPLRDLAMALSPRAPNPATSLLAGEAQTGWMMIWLALAFWFFLKVGRDRAPRPVTIGHPLRYSGGLFVACVGAGILAGAVTNIIGWCVLGGFVLGFIAARRSAPWVRERWGRPSLAQLRVLVFAVGLEITIFAALGRSGFFVHAPRAMVWQTSLAIVGLHFLVMRFSHGPMMLALGAVVLGWLEIGQLLHLPPQVMAAGDGTIKLVFGLAMAWPLLRPTSPRLEQQTA
jgi:uncharacterized membrane protein